MFPSSPIDLRFVRFILLAVLFFIGPMRGFSEPVQVAGEGSVTIETVVLENFLKQIKYTAWEKTPKWDREEGVWIYPSIDIEAYTVIRDSDNQLRMDIAVDVNGVATSGKSERVLGKSVGASSKSTINAHFKKPVYFTGGGIQSGALEGYPRISTQITTRNNFRLPILRRMAHRGASREAQSRVAYKQPKAKKELYDQVSQAASHAMDEAKKKVLEEMGKANMVLSESKEFPFKIQMRSRATDSDNQGFIQVSMKDPDLKLTDLPPNPSHLDQTALYSRIREQALEKGLGQLVAGKELRIRDLKKILCDSQLKKALDFCNKEEPDSADLLSILFDSERPIDLEFKDNEIKVRLNAIYQIHNNDVLTARHGALLREATDPKKLAFGEVPYVVEFSYSLKDGFAERNFLRVAERQASGNSDAGHSWLGKDLGKELMKPVVKSQVEKKFDSMLKKRVDYQPIAMPVEFHMMNPASSAVQSITKTGGLVPLEMRAENGWLLTSNYYCAESMPSLGVSFHPEKDREGNLSYRITQAVEGSPAYQVGLRKGDKFVSYGLCSSKDQKPVEDEYLGFLDFISATASQLSASGRNVCLVGENAQGKSFKKEIVLCPKGIDYRSQVDELVKKVSETAKP